MEPYGSENNLETSLTNQLARIQAKLASFEQQDSLNLPPRSTELGTRSWEDDVHATRLIIKTELLGVLKATKQTLEKIKDGIYGKCESCGSEIEAARLKIMPTANLCLSCTR